jgi:hypothetical protein
VGINTEDPQGLLHIDAKSNTVVNSSDTLNVGDDVVVTPQGRIGVGTTNPQTRLDIRSATSGAIRIQDGTEGAGKTLVSDANGSAQWEQIIWYAELKGGSSVGATSGSTAQIWPPFTFTGSELFPAGAGGVDPTAGTIQVLYTGLYRLTLTGTADDNRLSSGMFRSAIQLLVGAKVINFNFTHMMKELGVVDVGHIYMLSLTAGDVLKLSPYTGNIIEANVYTDVRLALEYVR